MKLSIYVSLVFLLLASQAFAQNQDLRSKHFNLSKGIALNGYDPVAYFNQNKAIKGNKTITSQFMGVVYCFSNQSNKDIFVKNPGAYEPEYGGWCAYAMGDKAKKVEVDPKTFKIVHGKLYLFYNSFLNNTLTSWNKDENNLKSKADKNWQILFK